MVCAISFGDANASFQAGIVNGSVNTAFHLPSEPRETPPLPDIVIPFARDTDFVERGTTLDQVDLICAAPNSRAALVGLGGVGKSQLAIEHAHRTHKQSPETWVFWVHASNAARFEQSYRDIADRVKIFGRRDPQANIFKLVHDWLCDSRQRWLLVLDNVDDARFLLGDQADGDDQGQTTNAQVIRKPLREYLPHCERGSILVTTRNKEAALKLVEQRDIVSVEPMDKSEGIALFTKKLGLQGDNIDVAELAAALEYMPLAIVQAAAYILQRAPRCSVAKYLDEYRKSEREQTSLLDHDKGHLRRDREAKNSILVTWQISFEYIQQTRSSAADLLSLMSFFDRQGISEDLLRPRTERQGAQNIQTEKLGNHRDSDSKDDVSQSSAGDNGFEDDIVALRNFCFISVDTSGTSFEMHALVQLATRMWLEVNSKLEQWKEQFISNLCAALPTGEYENWVTCRALVAHARSAAGQPPEHEPSLAEWATLLYRAAWYAASMGNITEAATLATKSMRARKKMLGQDQDTLSTMAMTGLAYNIGGRWGDAEKLEVQVMETSKKELGADHPDTLTSMNNLAITYWRQGRWDAAEELQLQVMELSKKKLGINHPDTLTSMGNLASTYKERGRLGDAEELEVQVMDCLKKTPGVDHHDTLTSMNNLAITYWRQRRWVDAEKLQVQVMETRMTKFGADHPDTLTSMNNLAITYWRQGRWDAAEELQLQVMELSKKKLGINHPDTLKSMGNLASTYKEQERLEDAEELEVQVVNSLKKTPGIDHPDTLTSMANLALTYWKQGRFENAEKLEVQVMETRKKKLGADHPDTLTSMANLAFTWKAQGRNEEAIILMRQCVQQRQQVLKASDPSLKSSLAALEEWEAE